MKVGDDENGHAGVGAVNAMKGKACSEFYHRSVQAYSDDFKQLTPSDGLTVVPEALDILLHADKELFQSLIGKAADDLLHRLMVDLRQLSGLLLLGGGGENGRDAGAEGMAAVFGEDGF
jgi:hypothetical protein